MVRFKEDEIIKFLELYKKYECLWNCNHQYYKVKSARTEAYSLIRKAMNLDSDLEVKLKIKSFRDTYASEKAKLQKSLMSATHPAELYRPKLRWYNLADSFLSHIYGRDGDDAMVAPDDTQDGSVLPPSSRESVNFFGQTEAQIPPPYRMMDHSQSQTTNNIISSLHKPKVNKNKQHLRTGNILRRNICSVQRNPEQKDEFYHFAMNVAIQLRSLPLVSALNLQTKFQQMLCEERIACEHSRYGDYENRRSSSVDNDSPTSYQENLALLPPQNGEILKEEYSMEDMTGCNLRGGF